jgi:hypothetical protein
MTLTRAGPLPVFRQTLHVPSSGFRCWQFSHKAVCRGEAVIGRQGARCVDRVDRVVSEPGFLSAAPMHWACHSDELANLCPFLLSRTEARGSSQSTHFPSCPQNFQSCPQKGATCPPELPKLSPEGSNVRPRTSKAVPRREQHSPQNFQSCPQKGATCPLELPKLSQKGATCPLPRISQAVPRREQHAPQNYPSCP